jgi:hypothetical protein
MTIKGLLSIAFVVVFAGNLGAQHKYDSLLLVWNNPKNTDTIRAKAALQYLTIFL